MIKRISLRYTLAVDADAPVDKVHRVMGFYRDNCPVYRSISGSIAFSDDIEIVAAG